MKWLFAVLLVLQAHFAASYLVPLDSRAQREFGGLWRGAWPWSIGDGGILGRIPASGEYPIVGVWLAGGAALLSILAALAVMGWWVPFGWWRVCWLWEELPSRSCSWWASSEGRNCCRWSLTSSFCGQP
jgi:hypothetical protein